MTLIKRHPLVTFIVLAYGFSWGVWLLSADMPDLLYATGPLVAAFIVTALTGGWSGIKVLLSRIVRWRVGLRWYVVALVLPVVLTLIVVALNIALGAHAPTAAQLGGWPNLWFPFLIVFFLIAMGEEPGWRGFALPRLQAGRSALTASFILGVIWAGWHIPQLINDQGTTVADILLTWMPALLSTIIATILITWVFNNTNGSVLLTMLFHASYGTIGNQFFYHLFMSTAAVRLSWLIVVVWGVAALLIVLVAGPARLSRTSMSVTMAGAEAA